MHSPSKRQLCLLEDFRENRAPSLDYKVLFRAIDNFVIVEKLGD